MLSPEILRDGLETKTFGRKVYSFETIDSTNSCARALAACWAEEGTVVLSEEQTAGRGRLGRSWSSSPSENLTFSIVLRPQITPDVMNILSLLVAVGIARGLKEHAGVHVLCKWPNDILFRRRKLAGILLEGALSGDRVESVIVGIGLNVNQQIFPEDLQARATSLALASGHYYDRPKLFKGILTTLEDEYLTQAGLGFKHVVDRWLEHAPMIGKRITVDSNGAEIEGTVRGITDSGGLVVASQTGEHTFLAGDVTILDMEPYASGD
ncbi:MAG: biotin--[acetyl-CoA-carboxylase] ligase [Bacteroidetes bacterium]|nr:biotin--[acetyl-CoA-carboxylase] ligase [Bacteroidota bacterium]